MAVESFKLARSYILTKVWRLDPFLVIGASGNTATVIDLRTHPPTLHLWEDVSYLQGIERCEGGYAVLSRTGKDAGDIRFPLWRHSGERPDQGSLRDGLFYGDGRQHVDGLTSCGGGLYTSANLAIGYDPPYYLLHLHADGWHKVAIEPSMKRHDVATAVCGDSTEVLLWDGDGFTRQGDSWQRTFKLGLDTYDRPWTVAWAGERGFYFSRSDGVFRVKAGHEPELVTSRAPAWNLAEGPNGTLIGATVDRKRGELAYVINPETGKGMTLRRKDLVEPVRGEGAKFFVYSAYTRKFYLYTWRLWVFDEANIMGRRMTKLPR